MTGLLFWSISLSIKEGSCLSTIVFKQIWSGWLLSPVSYHQTLFSLLCFLSTYYVLAAFLSCVLTHVQVGEVGQMDGTEVLIFPHLRSCTEATGCQTFILSNLPPCLVLYLQCSIKYLWRFQSSCSWSFTLCVSFLVCATVRTKIHIIFAELEHAGYVRTFWLVPTSLGGLRVKARKWGKGSAFYQRVLTKIEVQICVLCLCVHLSASGRDSGCFITPHFNWQIHKTAGVC